MDGNLDLTERNNEVDLTARELFGMAIRAVVGTILLYVLWFVVIGIGAAIIAFAPYDDFAMFMLSRAAGAALVIFGVIMALLSMSAVVIKISVGESTRRAARRMRSETGRFERRIEDLNRRRADPPASESPGSFAEETRRRDAARPAGSTRPARRADPPISERPGSFEEAMRRRDAARSARNGS